MGRGHDNATQFFRAARLAGVRLTPGNLRSAAATFVASRIAEGRPRPGAAPRAAPRLSARNVGDLWITGRITPDTPRKAAARLGALRAAGARAILMTVDSEGGDVRAALDLHDALKACVLPVVAYVERAHSAASVIALGAGHLVMDRDGTMLLHRTTGGTGPEERRSYDARLALVYSEASRGRTGSTSSRCCSAATACSTRRQRSAAATWTRSARRCAPSRWRTCTRRGPRRSPPVARRSPHGGAKPWPSVSIVHGSPRGSRSSTGSTRPPRSGTRASPRAGSRFPSPRPTSSKWERAARATFLPCLQRLRITTADDAAAFELLCSSWAEAQKLREVLRREGVTYETLKSQGTRMVRARPELTALGDIDRRVLNLLARFGLTPADRSRVSDLALPDPTSNPDDEFIS